MTHRGERRSPVPTSTAYHDERTSRVFGLDVIRASAITLVLIAHLVHPAEFLGIAGVELFFGLSGYLVGGIFFDLMLTPRGRTTQGLFHFLRRRWARTIPNYLLYLFLWFLVLPPRYSSILPYFAFMQNLAWPIGDFFGVSWSLTVEEWFYLLIPGAIFVAALFRGPAWAALAVIMLTVAVCFTLRAMAHVTDANNDLKWIVIYRLDALALGVGAAVLARLKPAIWDRIALAWPFGLILMVGLSALLYFRSRHLTGVPASTLFVGLPLASVLLIAQAVKLPSFGPVGDFAVTKISLWSYSMYLSHMLIYLTYFDVPGYSGLSVAAKFGAKVAATVAVVCVSALTYYAFERPMLKLLSPRKYI